MIKSPFEKEFLKGIYLGACLDTSYIYDMDFNDVEELPNINLCCDMMSIDLTKYDYIIASPPCNFWSIANYRRNESKYALETRHLLPDIIVKAVESGKPFLIENVRNFPLFEKYGIIQYCSDHNVNIYFVGRHTYFTNKKYDEIKNVEQIIDYVTRKSPHSKNPKNYRQGGQNVHNVINKWIECLHIEHINFLVEKEFE